MFQVADPAYDSGKDTLTYTATKIEADQGASALPQGEIDQVPPSFEAAHLFIDPSSGDAVPVFFNQSGTQGRTTITFDAPWAAIVGDGDLGLSIAGNAGGGLITRVATLNGSSEIEFALAGGTPPVTGSVRLAGGARVTAQAGDGQTITPKNGKFSLSP